MVPNRFPKSSSAKPASPQTLCAPMARTSIFNACLKRPSDVTDILMIGANPTLGLYMSGLFQKSGWTARRAADCTRALEFLETSWAAVAICEENLPDARWQDALTVINSGPNPPMFVLIAGDRALLDDVLPLGCFDVLARPLREADVIWTVATAWHQWMNRYEDPQTRGMPCSGG